MIPVGLLDAEKTVETVVLYVFRKKITASLFLLIANIQVERFEKETMEFVKSELGIQPVRSKR